MSILALFGLPFERVLNVSLGSDTFFAVKTRPQLYGSSETIVFDYSNETSVNLEFFDDDSGLRYSRFYLTAHRVYPAIPKVPVAFAQRPNSASDKKDGDPVGVYSKPVGLPPTGAEITHPSPNARLISSNNPKLTTIENRNLWSIEKTTYLQYNRDLTPEQYDVMYPLPRDAVLQYIGDWSGGHKYYNTAAQPAITEYGFTRYEGIFSVSSLNQSNPADLQYTAVPVRLFDDNDNPPVRPRAIGVPDESVTNYDTRWRAEREAAVERERPLRVENSDRVIAALKAGQLTAEVSTAILGKKPCFMETRLDPSLVITVNDIVVLEDEAVSGRGNPRENHPKRPYFYTPAVVERFMTPGAFGYNWSSGAREKISAPITVSIRLRRKVTVEYKVRDETANEEAYITKKFDYEGEVEITQNYVYADYPNALYTRYKFKRWPMVGEDGLAPYYGEYAEILDNLYSRRNVERVAGSMVDVEYVLLRAKDKRTEERDAAQAALNAYPSDGNAQQRAALQDALNRANAALTEASAIHTIARNALPADATALDKVRTAPCYVRTLDRFGDGLYSAVLLTGTAGVNYGNAQAQYVIHTPLHPVAEASRWLRAYHARVTRALSDAHKEHALAQKTEDKERKDKATAAKDAAVSHEQMVRALMERSEASETLGQTAMGETLYAEQVSGLLEYAHDFPAASRSYYDI